jgi:hypothetical protein
MVDSRSRIRQSILQNMTSTISLIRTPSTTKTIPISIGSLEDPLPPYLSLDGSDPLTQFVEHEMDPLSKMASDEVNKLNTFYIYSNV